MLNISSDSCMSKNTFLIFFLQFFLLISLFIGCDNIDKYYRPNTPEKISVIGIIDADDTIRYISIEKSYQKEYPEEINDSLRNLSFEIKSSDQILYSYCSEFPLKNLNDLKIPGDIQFTSGEKYFLEVSEKSCKGILSESTVPLPPSGFKLISFGNEIITLSEPQECPFKSPKYKSTKYAVLNLIFDIDKISESYYSLLIEANGLKGFSSTSHYFLPIEFTIRECNAPGFFSTMKGFYGHRWVCADSGYGRQVVPVNLYFIDPNKITDDKCTIKVSVKYGDLYSAVDYIADFRIKVLSVPKELYFFEKSIAAFNKSIKDPLSEPVYIHGNIKGGNGVFAICRSSNLTLKWKNI